MKEQGHYIGLRKKLSSHLKGWADGVSAGRVLGLFGDGLSNWSKTPSVQLCRGAGQ